MLKYYFELYLYLSFIIFAAFSIVKHKLYLFIKASASYSILITSKISTRTYVSIYFIIDYRPKDPAN